MTAFAASHPTCLLIVPLAFYSFGHTLRKELEARGMTVVMENDEFPANVLGKVMGKLRILKPLRSLTLKQFRRRYGGQRFDLVLIVKGRGVSDELIAFLRSISRRVVGYNFDSFKFNPSPLQWLHAVHRYCTFDIMDAEERCLPLVHLFSALPAGISADEKHYDISVLMKNHSQRLAYADRVLSALPGSARFVYIFEPHIFSFALGVLRSPLLYLKHWSDIHLQPLPYGEFLKVLGESRVTIDYAHPSQAGITIRCFEARSLGVAIVTNNPHVFDHPFFDADTAAHFSLTGDTEKMVADVQRLVAGSPGRSVRSVTEFISDLLAEPAADVLVVDGSDVRD